MLPGLIFLKSICNNLNMEQKRRDMLLNLSSTKKNLKVQYVQWDM